ncbi:lasso peptide biosynthesis B2 protein [Pelagerythrobacter sp.]|uniref:lasso peptide biosynthesis B2 protein n=1 Tax=Pelagerythrobacter sp. TaxID=2800702 RepID=UPI0035B39479
MRMATLLARKWRSFGGYPLAVRMLVPVAFVLLGLARLAILILPFRLYAPLLGQRRPQQAERDWREGPSLDPPQDGRAFAIKQAIRVAARLTPWRSVCLPQALVAAALMRPLGIGFTAHLGVTRDDEGAGPMQAHAWTVAGGAIVTGAGQLARYTRVARFVHDPQRRLR